MQVGRAIKREMAESEQMDFSASAVVIGEGWAALGAVGFLCGSGVSVVWLSGTGARMAPALPSLDSRHGNRGVEAWRRLAALCSEESESGEGMESRSGVFLREFRNKAFREPTWMNQKGKDPETLDRVEGLRERLWEGEWNLAPAFEARFDDSIEEIEAKVRAYLLDGKFPGLQRREGIPVVGFETEKGRIHAVVLGSGEKIRCERVIYADRWSELPLLKGLPKGMAFLRKHHPMGILQATFEHEVPVGAGLQEGFFGALHRESGEQLDKHVWGYFSSDGMRSFWTLALTPEEVEDNQAIGRKYRRMKSALNKMFTGSGWLPEGREEFMEVIRGEHVHFEESLLFSGDGRVEAPLTLSGLEGFSLLTDGYGPAVALELAALETDALKASEASVDCASSLRTSSQAEGVDLLDTVSP